MDISKRTLKILIAISGFLLINRLFRIYQAFYFILNEMPNESNSVGIIGGMDGPTAIFLASKLLPHLILPLLCFLLEIFLYLYVLIKSVKAVKK